MNTKTQSPINSSINLNTNQLHLINMSEDDKKQLITRRTRIKAALTRFETFLAKIANRTDDVSTELQTRLDAITSLFADFDLIQAQIEELEPEEDDKHEKERITFEDKYFALVASAKQRLQTPQTLTSFANDVTVAQTTTASSNNNNQNSTNSSSQFNINLPAISLPEFSGSYDKWTQFHEVFKSLINDNKSLTNVQRFFYLQSALKGEASQIISSLSNTDDNYKIAWDLLTERYENKRAIIHSHLKSIFDLPVVPKESHICLRKFLDSFQKHFRSLKNLGENVDDWNTILIFLLNSKLDAASRKEWEIHIKSNNSPKINDFVKFLGQRCQLLESLDSKLIINNNNQCIQIKKPNDRRPVNTTTNQHYSHLSTNNSKGTTCPLCKEQHFIYDCKSFCDIPVNNRYAEAKKLNLCTNCLRSGHTNQNCRSLHTCRICRKRHHSLLHANNQANTNVNNNDNLNIHNNRTPDPNLNSSRQNVDNHSSAHNSNADSTLAVSVPFVPQSSNNNCTHTMTSQTTQAFVILSTAVVDVLDKHGQPVKCRALLDNGSQSNFVSKSFFDKLKLKSSNINIPISGISQSTINISKRAFIKWKSLHSRFHSELQFLVIDKITGITPQVTIDLTNLKIPTCIKLADPNFNVPSNIDMLLGAEIFFEILGTNQIRLGKHLPLLHESQLGWIVSGPILNTKSENPTSSCFLASNDIDTQLQTFWKIEENYSEPKPLTREEAECESHFIHTFSRDLTGRFVVNLPLKSNYTHLGDSLDIALKRFYAIERKLLKNPVLRSQYSEFMQEYQTLGHMTKINPLQSSEVPIYYMPHHCVEKHDSTTTKLRVVFDASAKTTTNISLNDVLKVGPTIQNDLFSIILRFRKHNYVLTGDIAKMYRQINVVETQRDLQRILWRDTPESEISHFQLKTVTYGLHQHHFSLLAVLSKLR